MMYISQWALTIESIRNKNMKVHLHQQQMSMSFSYINTILKYHQITKFHSLLASLNAVKKTYQARPVPFFKQVEECSSSALLPVVYSVKNV